MTDQTPDRGRVLLTGATGYVGGLLLPKLVENGWQVRVLARNPKKLKGVDARVEVVEGDASSASDVRSALEGVDVAYFLLHSMSGGSDFVERDRELATTFADACADAGVRRIVYLSGLHPEGELSAHMASRVEVGDVFLDSPVPAVVLQAGVVLGDGSASFDMLRHLTERLPAMITPRWAQNEIQPLAIDDALHYLASAADLPDDLNRTFDIGGADVLTYAEMMRRYAQVVGLGRRVIVGVPVLSPGLASHWVSFITPVDASMAKPLVGSLIHPAVCREQDLLELVGPPPGGRTGYDMAIRAAVHGLDPLRWRRALRRTSAAVAVAAVAGSLLTRPGSAWYQGLRLPTWQPPPAAFPLVWTALFAGIAVTSAATTSELQEAGREPDAKAFERALALNLLLNVGWSALFWRARRPDLAAAEAAVLAISSADLARRAAPVGRGKAAVLGGYAAWCGFATALSTAIARRNPRSAGR